MLMELDQLVLVVALMELLSMLIIHVENVILSVYLALLSSLAPVANQNLFYFMDSVSKVAQVVIIQKVYQIMFHVNCVIQHAKPVEMQTTVKLVCQRLLLSKMEFASKKIHV